MLAVIDRPRLQVTRAPMRRLLAMQLRGSSSRSNGRFAVGSMKRSRQPRLAAEFQSLHMNTLSFGSALSCPPGTLNAAYPV